MDLARGRQIHGSGEAPSPKMRPLAPRSEAAISDFLWKRDPSLIHGSDRSDNEDGGEGEGDD
eukprot:7609090-Pyramimonas_sp.AAC.1